MKKIALIDFCGTITDFQTLSPYLEQLLKERSKYRYYLFCNPIDRLGYRVLSKIGRHLFGKPFPYKQLLVRLLKGVRVEDFISAGTVFYENMVKPHIIPEIISLLGKLKREGYTLLIVSGGSGFYITHFADEFGIDECLTAKIGFIDGRCSGKIINECMREKKVEVIGEFVRDNNWDCSFEVGLTDSVSDMPMLNMCKEKIIVSFQAHQDWVTGDMKEIIYNIS